MFKCMNVGNVSGKIIRIFETIVTTYFYVSNVYEECSANKMTMKKITEHIFTFTLLGAFLLYTLPLCQCVATAEQAKANKVCDCCESENSSAPKDCCKDGMNAEKMQTEKAFESAKTPVLDLFSSTILLLANAGVSPTLIASSQLLSQDFPPPTLSRLQRFRI
jgi:hypothetical protein